jgi:hypothetical protein
LPDAGSTPVICGAFCATASEANTITPARKTHRHGALPLLPALFLLLGLEKEGNLSKFRPPAERVAIVHLTQG